MPNNLLKFAVKYKTSTISYEQESASILGQLVWTFTQYFPIACVFVLVARSILIFLLREGIFRRAVIHDQL